VRSCCSPHRDGLLQTISLSQLGDDLVEAVTDLLVTLGGEHVIERAAFRDVDQAIRVGLCLIGYVLHNSNVRM
jgi:hypothetical protein